MSVETQEVPANQETGVAPVENVENNPVFPAMSGGLKENLRGLLGGSAESPFSTRELLNMVADQKLPESAAAPEVASTETTGIDPVTPVETSDTAPGAEAAVLPEASVITAVPEMSQTPAVAVPETNDTPEENVITAVEAPVTAPVPEQEVSVVDVETNPVAESVITPVEAPASEAGKAPENVITAVETPQTSQEAVLTDEVGTSAVEASTGEVDAGLVETPATAPEVSQDAVSPVDTSGAEKQSVKAESDELKIEWPEMVDAQINARASSDDTETTTEESGVQSQQVEESISKENTYKSEENSDIEQVSSSETEADGETVAGDNSSEVENVAETESAEVEVADVQDEEKAEDEVEPVSPTASIPVPEESILNAAESDGGDADAQAESIPKATDEVDDAAALAKWQENANAEGETNGSLQMMNNGDSERPPIWDIDTGEQVGGDKVEETASGLPKPDLPGVKSEEVTVDVEDSEGNPEEMEAPAMVEEYPVQVEAKAENELNEDEVAPGKTAETETAGTEEPEFDLANAEENKSIETEETVPDNLISLEEYRKREDMAVSLSKERISNENRRTAAAASVNLGLVIRAEGILLRTKALYAESEGKRAKKLSSTLVNPDEEMAEAA